MNEEISTEFIQEDVIQEQESASDPEVITEGSETDLEIESEVKTEDETEVETEVDTEKVTNQDLEDLKESINSSNESINAITTILLENENSETLDYTEVLENTYIDNIRFNNNFCIGVTTLTLILGIVSGILVGFAFKEILKK